MKRAVALGIGMLVWSGVDAGPAPSDPGWVSLQPGLEYREVTRGSSGDSIFQLRCDLGHVRLGLVTARDFKKPKMMVGELVERSHALAAVNGGYFDEKDEPMGYQRDARRVVCATVRTAGLFGGVFVIGPRGAALLGREDFSPGDGSFALQCGPRLIYQGRKVEGIHADPPTRRTGLGVDRRGRAFLYATGTSARFTFAECQDWLSGPSSQGGLDPVGVLNLDGGSSTQMSVRTKGFSKDVPTWAPVPVAVGVFPR